MIAPASPLSCQWGVPPRVGAILNETAARHSLAVGDLMGSSRERSITVARQAACAALRNMEWRSAQPSFPQIGQWMGLHYTTVMNAVQAHKERTEGPMRVIAGVYQNGWQAGRLTGQNGQNGA